MCVLVCMCVCVYLLQFAGQVLNLSRAGALEPDAVVSDVEVVHDIVWLRGIENPSHIQQTLQQLPATFVCTCEYIKQKSDLMHFKTRTTLAVY